ncbi:hypothetical protein A8C32_05685 [Flavivirga aquatica]|uniref:LamG-like jellyroll fold domain-containing protein n=1 Tax=Flavivirga aquatica TaxID=1849968 RepID=A0A1E5SHU7_9FLAO|nr:LamG-like jellyroll fold domain-containing protein [Flavivirga aquatica]OEJ98688.1 hypothetical protein A8C32_05685 [Flavivirga aquatica]
MKKFYSPPKQVLIVLFSILSYLSIAQDFNVQHLQDDINNLGGTNTSFTAVSSLNNAVALANNNRKTHGGSNGVTAAREGDDMAGARVLTATNTLTYFRESGSQAENTRFNTSIWEYTGSGGGANEMIVRGRYAVDLNGGTYTINQAISGITNADKCIPFITGIMNNSGTDDADSGTAIAYLTSSTNLRIEKGGTNVPDVRVYITLVEFTGSNWTVLHGDSGDVSGDTGTITLFDGSDGTGTATDVSSWNNAIIFSHHRGDTDTGGTNDSHSDNWPSIKNGANNQSVDWTFFSSHDSDGTNRHFVHVLANAGISVTRFSDTSSATSVTIDITSAALTDLNQSLIVGSSYHSGTGAGYGRGWRNYKLNSLTEAEHWVHRAGGGTSTLGHEIQIVNLANAGNITQGPGGVTSNIELWLKADSGVEEAASDSAEDTDPVLNWLDKSGNSNDATQATVPNQPLFDATAINFNPMVHFDGTNHEMLATTAPNSTMTIFAVAEGTFSTTKNLLDFNAGATGSIVLEQTASTTLQSRYFNGATPTGVITTTIADATPFLANYDFVANSNSELFSGGVTQGTAATNAYTLPASVTTGIGTDPNDINRRWDGGIAELIVYNKSITSGERDQIESYLAIKYGMTLGANGISQDYVASDGTVIWDQAANSGFNFNVAGIGLDNDSELNQKQSKSTNTSDDITIGIIDIATSNSTNTNTFFADKTFLMWGNDNGSTAAGTPINKDFGAGTGVTTNVSFTPIGRKWKIVVKDSVPTIKLSIPESMVSSTLTSGGSYVMAISDDASFTTNVTSATMEDVGSELEVDFYFEGTKYITFGYAPESATLSRAASFDGTNAYLTAGDVNDLANTNYTISAWVKRNVGEDKFDVVSKRNYFNEENALPEAYTHGYAFRINSTGQFRMVWRDPADSSNNVMQTTATIPENEWHHICATFDMATNLTNLYIDGFLEDSDDTLDPMNVPSDGHFMIGAAHYIKRQQRARGSIDEVRVWDVTLSADQIRYIMNQEIENNSNFADGKVLPSATTRNEIIPIPWANLIGYYPMSTFIFGSVKDESNSRNDATMINYNTIDSQTAPLPYKTVQDGDWDTSTTWENGDVQYLPGVTSYLDVNETIDYNIVEIDHNVTMNNSNTTLIPAAKNGKRVLLGLEVNNTGDLQINGNTATNTGFDLTVSHYLKIDGTLDLEGESQLIQGENSDFETTSTGTLERDQQGNASTYLYNYWSSPVAPTSSGSYTLPDVFSGTTFLTTGINGAASPLSIADYWIWKYNNRGGNTYSEWQHVRSTGSLNAGEGFTMKGPGALTSNQNYIFQGQPNNGDITLTISAGNDYLVGNPYPSAIDANQFIMDNLGTTDGGNNVNGNIINGALYFWDHFANNTHNLSEYEGGYATYTLLGGAVAISNDTRIDPSGTSGTKIPERYIPVAQGFFVSAVLDPALPVTNPVIGGSLLFKNSQRIFQKETVSGANTGSIFIKNNSKKKASITNKNTDDRQKIRLMFDSPEGYHRQLLVGIDENASNDFDLGYDATLIESNKEDTYWVFNNNNFVIQAVNNFNKEQKLPIGIKIRTNGLAELKIDTLENIDDKLNIYIHDKELDVYHDLRKGSYKIHLNTGEYLDRFEITFFDLNNLGTDDFEKNNLEVFFSNEKESIIINNPKTKLIDTVKLYNILGQPIKTFNTESNESYIERKTEALYLTTGVYIIKVKVENTILSKKISIK